MEKAIEIIENKITYLLKYEGIETFKTRILILNDVLKELKSQKSL
jgi:hypothetical protein